MIDFILAIGVLFSALLGCLLCIPFHFVAEGAWARKTSAAVGVHWLFHLLRLRYDLISRKGELSFKNQRLYGWKNRLAPECFKLLSNLPVFLKNWKKVRPSLKISGGVRSIIGLEDPADTGMVFGILSGMAMALPLPLVFRPDFERARFELEWDMDIQVRMASLILPFLGIVTSRRGWGILRNF
jgi:hypothetical protein